VRDRSVRRVDAVAGGARRSLRRADRDNTLGSLGVDADDMCGPSEAVCEAFGERSLGPQIDRGEPAEEHGRSL
jgi:hypothetical protein